MDFNGNETLQDINGYKWTHQLGHIRLLDVLQQNIVRGIWEQVDVHSGIEEAIRQIICCSHCREEVNEVEGWRWKLRSITCNVEIQSSVVCKYLSDAISCLCDWIRYVQVKSRSAARAIKGWVQQTSKASNIATCTACRRCKVPASISAPNYLQKLTIRASQDTFRRTKTFLRS